METKAAPAVDLYDAETTSKSKPTEKHKRNKLGLRRLAECHKALAKYKGSRRKSAMDLGITEGTLHAYIMENPSLNARWSNIDERTQYQTALREVDALSSDEVTGAMFPAPPDIDAIIKASHTDKQLAESMEREEAKFKKGLDSLGLSDKEKDLAMAMQAFHSKQFKQSIEIQGAGVTRLSIKFQTVIDHLIGNRLARIWEWLDACEKNDPARVNLVKEERMIMTSLIELSGQALRNSEVANRGAMTMALIRWRMTNGDNSRPSKPGFTNTIQLQEQNDKKQGS